MKTTWNASWEMTYSFSQTDEFSRFTIFIQCGSFPSQQLAVLFGPFHTERRKISTKYSPASMSVFHQSTTNVHTQNTRQYFKHLTQSGKVQSLMNLGSWFKGNVRNVHRPSYARNSSLSMYAGTIFGLPSVTL